IGLNAATTTTFPVIDPDWTRVIDRSSDRLQYEEIGDGRERAVDGDEAPMRWVQEAQFTLRSRAEILAMLAWFFGVRGRWKSFTAPVWFRPGSDLPETPHETRVRSAKDTLTLSFQGGSIAKLTLSLEQVPWEISGVEGEEPEQEE